MRFNAEQSQRVSASSSQENTLPKLNKLEEKSAKQDLFFIFHFLVISFVLFKCELVPPQRQWGG